jgi:Tol biopolymer transport system component
MKRSLLLLLGAAAALAQRPPVRSHINLFEPGARFNEVIYTAERLLEAPNWSPDGRYLLLNGEGRLWKLSLDGGDPVPVDTGGVKGVNNDHGISPDGKWFVVSAGHMYVLPAGGGSPRRITERTPSYYHGWSPDGRRLAFCGQRDGNFDLYDVPVEGGPERRLTVHAGYDDGPDYSPDGQWIYFNSDRAGSWDVWRTPAGGAGDGDVLAERITRDEWEDWFPHPSPDGRAIVFLSFEKGTAGHPANRHVLLRMMPVEEGRPRPERVSTVWKLFGGQGTINVNSWSPDGKRLAFVSYTPLSR